MGNYAHLFTSDLETPDYTVEEDDICLQAKYAIPVFWCLLFDPACYRRVKPVHAYEDPDEPPDHFFTSTHDEALARYAKRSPLLFEVLPPDWLSLSEQFAGFLHSKPLRYIHMSIGDLASMVDGGYEDQVRYALGAFDESPLLHPTGMLARYRKPRLRDKWDSLLGLANIRYGKWDRVERWDLAGGGEGEAAPWEEER